MVQKKSKETIKMKKTRALICESLTEDLSGVFLKELELPEVSSRELLIKVKAASVNFPDLLMTQGKYQHCLLYTSPSPRDRG